MIIVPIDNNIENKKLFTIQYTKEELDKITLDFVTQMTNYIARVNNHRIIKTFEEIEKEETTAAEPKSYIDDDYTLIVRRKKKKEIDTTKMVLESPDDSSFIIHDNSSEIAKFIPYKYVEPLVIIARIQGFDGIDKYIIHLIKDRLEMFTDTRNELGESFQKYMHEIIIGPPDTEDKKDEEEEGKDIN